MPLESDKSSNSRSGDCPQSGKRLGTLLAAGRWLVNAERDDQLLPYWAVEEDSRTLRPAAIEQAWRRLSVRLKNDSSRNVRFQEMKRRKADEFDADSAEANLLTHFYKVSGHTADDLDDISSFVRPRMLRSESEVAIARTQAIPRIRRNRLVSKGSLLAPLFVVYVLILALTRPATSLSVTILDPEVQSIAWLNLGETSRGGGQIWELEMKAMYQQAFAQIRGSRTSILGVFPGFDRNKLSLAADLLEHAIIFQGQREISSSRAILLLAQARWHLGRTQDAKDLFQIVINRADDDTPMARDIIEKLESR